MVKLKFVIKSDTLVLRISEGKERFYRSAMSVLTGNPNLKRHFNQDRERFCSNAVSYKENNAALEAFKKSYQDIIFSHPDFSARQISLSLDALPSAKEPEEQTIQPSEYCENVRKFLEKVIQREKARPGCNFEVYQKLLNKCKRVLPDFDELTFPEIDYDKCVELASIFSEYDGYFNTAKQFRNLLGKAHRDREVNFRISQIGEFKFHDYDPNKDHTFFKKPDVLSPEQVKQFLNMDPVLMTPQYKDRNTVRLYYDFCVFMLQSFLAPCDVIKLKKCDITKQHTIVAKRKKTHRDVEIPISPAMDTIICRYQRFSKQGYIFPIMDDEKSKEHRTKDYIFKKFRQLLNIWLKDVGKELGTKFDLYAYVFRHTAITMALDNGLPISYVAIVAGTNIEMIQKHYYNGDNIRNSQKLQLMFIKAASYQPIRME